MFHCWGLTYCHVIQDDKKTIDKSPAPLNHQQPGPAFSLRCLSPALNYDNRVKLNQLILNIPRRNRKLMLCKPKNFDHWKVTSFVPIDITRSSTNFVTNVNWTSFCVTQGAFHLSELTGQTLPAVTRISLFIKTIQPDQSNPEQYARKRWFFKKNSRKKPISFSN